MTLYVNSQCACLNNIEIEGMGVPKRGWCHNLLGVIFFANTGVRFRMLSNKNSPFRVRVKICTSLYDVRVDIYIQDAGKLMQCSC